MKARILVIDDLEENLNLLRELLPKRIADCEVITALGGDEGLELARSADPDVVLLDANMPGTMGFEVCRELKQDPSTSQIPILIVSGVMTRADHRLTGFASGADGYLCKPYKPQELIAQVNVLIRIKRSQDELRTCRLQLENQLEARTGDLRDSESQLVTLFEHSPDAIFVEDVDGNVLDVNPAGCRLHEMTKEELIGKNVLDLVPPDHRDAVARDFPRLREKAVQALEGYSYTKSGNAVPIELRASPITYHGQPAILLHVRDITERRLSEKGLAKAEKLESLSVLAGGIAHDFNNILVGVIGNLSYAGEVLGSSDEGLREILNEAQRSAVRARKLTAQLLTFSKGGAPVRHTASIAELLREAGEFMRKGSPCACFFDVPDDLWPVDVDMLQISRVVENLVLNACQAMPNGGAIKIEGSNVLLGTEEALSLPPLTPGRFVQIHVRDNGPGIPAEHLGKIFDPYFSTKQEGSGLGLATAYSIVRRHDGLIAADSPDTGGAVFTIYLPASDSTPATNSQDCTEISRGAGRILVMDDEEIVRNVACRMLNALGYECECMSNGIETVEAFRDAIEAGSPFDAVILDLTIPGGEGGEVVLATIRALAPDVKAIVSSGYSDRPVLGAFEEYGFSGSVAKPYDLSELSRALHDVLNPA